MVPIAATIAVCTSELNIGAYTALTPFYDPVRLAENVTTLNHLSEGRFRPWTRVSNGGARELRSRGRRAGSTHQERGVFVTGCLGAGGLEYDPQFHPIQSGANVTSKLSSAPRILLGGGVTPAIRRAGRLADGWLALPTYSPEEVAAHRQDIEEVHETADIDREFTIFPGARWFVAEGSQRAWEQMREGYSYLIWQYEAFGGEGSVEELPEKRRSEEKERAIFGTPEEVVERHEAYEAAAGDDAHFVFRIFHPGIDYDTIVECIRLIGEEVRPHFVG